MILLFDLLSTEMRADFMMIYNVSCELIAELYRRTEATFKTKMSELKNRVGRRQIDQN